MSAPAPAPAPAPPPPTRTVAQHWQALYEQVEHLSPGAGQLLFQRARAGRGRWTLDEFKGWFNYNYPSFSRAGKFFVLYVFYALYLARDWVLDLDCCTAPYHRRRAREVFRRIDRIDVEDGAVTTEQMRAVLHANGVGPQPRACAAPSTPVRRV